MTKTWGPCTWFLFHTLAEKIREEHFMKLKPELINIVKNIYRRCNKQKRPY